MALHPELSAKLSRAKDRVTRALFEDTYTLAETADLRSLHEFQRVQTALGNIATPHSAVKLVEQAPARIIPQMPHFDTEVEVVAAEPTPDTDTSTHYVNELQELPTELELR